MSGTGKVLLFGCGGLLVLAVVAAVVIGVVFNYSYGRMLDEKSVEGREFGRANGKQGCLDKIMVRAKNTGNDLPSIKGLLADETFISSCLEASPTDPRFCDGVPGIGGEFKKTLQGAVYEEQVCKDLGYGQHNPTCNMVFSAKQKFCWSK